MLIGTAQYTDIFPRMHKSTDCEVQSVDCAVYKSTMPAHSIEYAMVPILGIPVHSMEFANPQVVFRSRYLRHLLYSKPNHSLLIILTLWSQVITSILIAVNNALSFTSISVH